MYTHMLKTFDELVEEESICNYCSATGYGEHTSASYVNSKGCYWCEGAYCEDAYKKYLDKNGATKNVVKYASKVRLINE